MQIFRWLSTRNNSVSSGQQLECIYSTWNEALPLFQLRFIEPENHQFRSSSSRWGKKRVFRRGLNGDYHGLWKKLSGFRLDKMVNFGFFSIYSANLKLVILTRICHLHSIIRICRMYKSLNDTYTFSQKVKSTFLTANKSKKIVFLIGEVIKKYGCQYCSLKWVLCKVQYFRRLIIDFNY